MRFKALVDKKIRELLDGRVYVGFAVLFALSFLAVFARLWGPSEIGGLLTVPLALIGFFLGFGCSVVAFAGDYVKEAHRFLEYLPVSRSAIWLVGYLTGVCVLCLSALLLFGTGLLLFRPPNPEVEYFVPGCFALATSGATALFWMYSLAVFFVAYLDTGKEGAASANVSGMVLGTMLVPVAAAVLLVRLHTLPSVTELIPVLLLSALLHSAGSYVLFAKMPRHTKRATRASCGCGLFLLFTAILLGHLYLKHFTWREIDVSEPLLVYGVRQPHPQNEPDLVLASVMSYRSGDHRVVIDVARGTYRDLGRWLTFVPVPDDEGGLLHFVYSRHGGYGKDFSAVTMTPDGELRDFFRVEAGDTYRARGPVKWLQHPRRLLYPAYREATQQSYVCVADSSGNLLKRFETHDDKFVLSPTNKVLARTPQRDAAASATSAVPDKPYMLIDLDAATIFRFDLPGQPIAFAKDLHRVICTRERIEKGFRYQSYVLVELPSLVQRVVLPEDELPPKELTSQVQATVEPILRTTDNQPLESFRLSETFAMAFWIRQRVENEFFRYSITAIDLDNGERYVVIPESDTPKLRVIAAADQLRTPPVTLNGSTTDGTGFLFEIGQRFHRYDLAKREHNVVADNDLAVDSSLEGLDINYSTAFSPTGLCVLRYGHVYEKSPDLRTSELKFGIIDAFEGGQPKRLYCEKQRVSTVSWLDEERIIFSTERAIHMLNATAGSVRQVFPPAGSGAATATRRSAR